MADGDADLLLDRILRNALGTDAPDAKAGANVKNEVTVKSETNVKKEVGIKSEHYKDSTIKNEGLAKGEAVKGEGVKGEGVKNESAKTEAGKKEIKGEVKGEMKGEIKGEKVKSEIKREAGADQYALAAIDPKKKDKKRSRSRSRKKKKKRSRSRKRKRSSSSGSGSGVGDAINGLPKARVVAVRGHWAQYLSPAGETFYKNVLNSEVQWQKPGNFDCQPSRRAGEMTPAPGEAACYIFHMPPEWGEADLMQLFAPFGQVTSAHVQRDANGFSRSCGFVTYAQAAHANEACNMMNGFGVDGKFLKVSLTQFSLGTGPEGAKPGGGGGPALPFK